MTAQKLLNARAKFTTNPTKPPPVGDNNRHGGTMDEQATTKVYRLKDYTAIFTFYDKFTFVSV